MTTCPKCGAPLDAIQNGPHTPPWLCRPCRRAWWASELTKEARAAFRPEYGDFRPHLPVKKAVEGELEQAVLAAKQKET